MEYFYNTYSITGRAPIRELQKYLLTISYATHGLPHLAIDGLFGPETKRALTLFQRQNGLSPTGQVNRLTWQELYRQYRAAREEGGSRGEALPVGLPLSLRSGGRAVSRLQLMLNEVEEGRGGTGHLPINGIFDLSTQYAVRHYQERRSLPPSGMVDGGTWRALEEDCRRSRYAAREKK